MVFCVFQASASDEGPRLMQKLCMTERQLTNKKRPSLVLRKCKALPMRFFFFNQLLQQSISTAGTSGRYLRPFHLCYLSTSLYVHAGWTIIFPSDLKAISSSPSFRLLTSGESIPKPITNLGFLVGLVWKKGQLQSLCRGKGYLTPLCWRTRACTKALVFFVIYSF